MVSTDPVSDMLTRIRNAIAVNKNVVSMPHSRMKESVAAILKSSGFIANVRVEGKGYTKLLIIETAKTGHNSPITEIKRISKPGRRMYAGVGEIPRVKNGRGVVVISTSKGVMTGDEAIKNRLGGELVCSVY